MGQGNLIRMIEQDEVSNIDYIIICKWKESDSGKRITARSEFFKDDVIIKIENNKILFQKPTIDYRLKTHKFYRDKKGFYHTTKHNVQTLPIGKYYIEEEESNEDCLVFYFQ